MAHSVLRRRDRPPILVDVGPPHGEHLTDALPGEKANAKQGAPSRVERVPQGSDFRRAQDAFATTLGRRPLNAVTGIGLDQSLPQLPTRTSQGHSKNAACNEGDGSGAILTEVLAGFGD